MLPKRQPNDSAEVLEYRDQIHQLPVDRNKVEELISEYLLAMGSTNTLRYFLDESSTNAARFDLADAASAYVRSQIRAYIRKGQMDKAMEIIEEFHPGLLLVEPYLRFAVYLQHLLELIRLEGAHMEAIRHSQNNMSNYTLQPIDGVYLTRDRLERALTSIAYPNPNQSAFYKDLYSHEHRISIADEVNSFLISLLDGSGMGGMPTCYDRGLVGGRVLHLNQGKLSQLYKLCDWAQTKLMQEGVPFITCEDNEKAIYREFKPQR